MAQARRIKAKSATKKKKSSGALKRLPWGLFLIILICGTVLGMLISGAQNNDEGFGSGLKELLRVTTPHEVKDQDIADLIETESTNDFEPDFYEVLPDIEQVMPDDPPTTNATRQRPNVDYFLQAASFREHADAEKLRARLALKGYKSVTQARDVEGKGRYFRVRLGPYANKREAKNGKSKLQRLGVKPFVYTVKKTADTEPQ